MMTGRRWMVGLITFFFWVSRAWGQEVQVTVWRDTIETAVGTTFTNRVVLYNAGKEAQEIHLATQGPETVQLLSHLPETLVLAPQDRIMLPIKGLVNWKGKAPVEPFTVRVLDGANRLLKAASFALVATQKNQSALSLSASNEAIILYSNSDPAPLSLQIVHNRNSRETYSLSIASLPAGIEQSAAPISLPLAAWQDTTLTLMVKPLRSWIVNTVYQLIVTFQDGQKSVVGSVVYKVMVAANSKRYIDASAPVSSGYGVAAGITKMSNNQWAREGRIWGTDSVGKTQMTLQMQYLDYVGSNYRQLQNSFISFRSERAMARLGSSYDFHELSLVGRGVKMSLTQPDYQLTLWAINSNPNWLHVPNMYAWSGNALSLRYDRKIAALPGASWSASSSFFTQSYAQREGYLNFVSFRYALPRYHSLEVLAGQSVEFAQRGSDRHQTFGRAGLVSYSYIRPKFSWLLRTYLSNPVYSGMQKGATLINSQLQWQPGPSTILAARYNKVDYNQVLFTSPGDSYHRVFGSTVAEVSLSQRLQPFTLSLRPYWYAQTDFSVPFGQQSTSYRLAPSVSYQRRPDLRFDVSYDAGTFLNKTDASPRGTYASQRIVSSIILGPFSFWGYWQKGPYYLFDLQNANPAKIRNASFTQLVDFALFKRKMIGSAGVNYVYDAFSAQSRLMGIGTIQYDITPNLSVRLSGYGMPYNPTNPEATFSQYRLLVTKRFNQLRLGHRGQLQLHFFEDANGNGRRESGERWMDSLLVTINENTLLTNAKGSITYRNLPPGTYTVSAISTSRLGDPLQFSEKITVTGLVNRQIPLARTFRIKGQLRCQTNTYDNHPCEFSRFGIEIEKNNERISSTIPLPDGTFAVHLAPGTYTVLVRDYGRQVQATVHKSTFTLSETGQYPALEWMVDGSTRAVEVQRFK